MRASRLCVLVVVALAWGALGGASGAPQSKDEQPEPLRIVEAEGFAPIVDGNISNARQAAIDRALREAVLRTVGVYVTGSVRVHNHIVQEDRVSTRAAGLAILEEVLEEGRADHVYRVRARVAVRLRPLLRELSSSPAVRRWRVGIVLASSTYYGYVPTAASDAAALLSRHLESLGIDADDQGAEVSGEEARQLQSATPAEVSDWGRRHGFDVVITGQVSARVAPGLSISRERLGIDYARCWVRAALRAIRCDTGEVVMADTVAGEGDGVPTQKAVHAGMTHTLRRAGRKLSESLLRLPGAASRAMCLTLSGFEGVTDATAFIEALSSVPAIRRVEGQTYTEGVLTLQVRVAEEAAASLGAHLESSAALQAFGLRVIRATPERVSGSVYAAETTG
ncbi:MAG: hypothetical protein GX785_13320 [Armatimonadetes bacterium]|nr:hypothetical protein [Armatimonadota bacterium]HOM80408.1 flagellar assembly protein T N-terminal domain-containing protein [Armatimonadota bacterium]HPO71992.1 flagellar assembly protein T N-terminal domain-containing protein [Armatimonadota bacterium]